MNIIVALRCEAEPFMKHLDLVRQVLNDGTVIYAAENIKWVVSGIGHRNATRAVHKLHAHDSRPAHWVNYGLGGHADLELGTFVEASSVQFADDKPCWTLSTPDSTKLKLPVVTVDAPESTYPKNVVYEMEAAGICTALATLPQGWTFNCAKIISDNRASPAKNITQDNAFTWVEKNMRDLVDWIR